MKGEGMCIDLESFTECFFFCPPDISLHKLFRVLTIRMDDSFIICFSANLRLG